jgi:hypothetical protein
LIFLPQVTRKWALQTVCLLKFVILKFPNKTWTWLGLDSLAGDQFGWFKLFQFKYLTQNDVGSQTNFCQIDDSTCGQSLQAEFEIFVAMVIGVILLRNTVPNVVEITL